MDDLLKGLIGGLDQQTPGASQTGGDLTDLIGGILGGSMSPAAQPARPQQGSSGLIGDLIGSVIGGNTQNSSPLIDLLGAVMGAQGGGGGMGMGGGASAMIANPIADFLAERLGISPSLARMIVSFFLAKMLSGAAAGTPVDGALPSNAGGRDGYRSDPSGATGLDLDHLLGNADDDASLRSNLMSSGMASELAQRAGIDEATATRGLQEVVKYIAGQREVPKPVKAQPDGLKDLLDVWNAQ